jgi:hypothetical protein
MCIRDYRLLSFVPNNRSMQSSSRNASPAPTLTDEAVGLFSSFSPSSSTSMSFFKYLSSIDELRHECTMPPRLRDIFVRPAQHCYVHVSNPVQTPPSSTPSTQCTARSQWHPTAWIHRHPRTKEDQFQEQTLWSSLTTRRHTRSSSEPVLGHTHPRRRRPAPIPPRPSSTSSSSSSTDTRPEKSILHRTSSMATTKSVKSMKSVKFVDMPTVHYDYGPVYAHHEDEEEDDYGYEISSQCKEMTMAEYEGSRAKERDKFQSRSLWERIQQPRATKSKSEIRPAISGPYRLSHGGTSSCPSLLDRADGGSLRSVKSCGRSESRSIGSGLRRGLVGRWFGRIASVIA